MKSSSMTATRRDVMAASFTLAAVAAAATAQPVAAASKKKTSTEATAGHGYVTASDGTQIFYKDWGPRDGQPIVFHHGWPLSSDDWDNQMLYFLGKGYRVIAHDRRGHGRSSQVNAGARHGSLCCGRRRRS